MSFIANSNRNLTANFQNNNTPQYNISAIYNFDAGSVTGQGLYQELQTVTLTANTNPNYNFLNWSENGAIISTNSTISFTANRNRKVVANFVSNIKSYEYWCYNDYSNKISVNISETNLLDLNNNIDVNNLNLIVGSNIFNFRAKDNTNNWSSVISTQFNYNGSLGVENIKNENSIKAYPNPIQDFVIIETNSNNIQNLKLYDTNGKILKDEKINNEAKYLLNLQALAQGMYLLEVDSEKSKQIFKIIKK